MAEFWQVTLGGLLGSGIATTIASAILLQRNSRVVSTRAWKEAALSELLGPAVMQLERTKHAFARWNRKNLYIEAKVVREGNLTVRDLFLSKGHLIPPPLMAHAVKLIEHYDRWLEEFETLRSTASPNNDEAFVFAGPSGFPFPHESEAAVYATFRDLQRELYGIGDAKPRGAPLTTGAPSYSDS